MRTNNQQQTDMAKYYGNFSVNNGTRLMRALESDNIKSLVKELKDRASSEIFQHNRGYITICNEDGLQIALYEARWRGAKVYWYNED